jgi:hypothetical protein
LIDTFYSWIDSSYSLIEMGTGHRVRDGMYLSSGERAGRPAFSQFRKANTCGIRENRGKNGRK